MTRPFFYLISPLLLLASGLVAFAADGSVPAPAPGAGPGAGLDYLLTLGPYGALAWGAYLLGRGVKLTIQVELSERDREWLERLARGGTP
ncbi:hypothetical protein L6R50_09140 [Myxococcota bacterium]|nr:hypothetical protein [Myxococcota bacterium]